MMRRFVPPSFTARPNVLGLVAPLACLGLALFAPAAHADVPPGPGEPDYICDAEGKPCETCDVFVGDRDAGDACGDEKRAKGLVLACENPGASNQRQYWCPPGTTVELKDISVKPVGCAVGPESGARPLPLGAGGGLAGVAVARLIGRRRRRSVTRA